MEQTNYTMDKNDYIRVAPVDAEVVAELVSAAKGTRSMREFAKEIGTNVSTVSRIISGKMPSISKELIYRIVEKAAPDSDVTVKKLMKAEGMVNKSDRAHRGHYFMLGCRQIIRDSLIEEGYQVQCISPAVFYRYSDFEINTSALENGEKAWLFECNFCGTKKEDIWGKRVRIDLLLDRIMSTFYQYGDLIGRYSIVLDSDEAIDIYKQIFEGHYWKDDISLIRIATLEKKVSYEYMIHRSDGIANKPIFQKEHE